jgi:hypothetical protein
MIRRGTLLRMEEEWGEVKDWFLAEVATAEFVLNLAVVYPSCFPNSM